MSADENPENFITDFDRKVADAVAEQFGDEPDYEWSASIRRNVEAVSMYREVYGLSYAGAEMIVIADDHERYANDNGLMTPVVAHCIAELRRLAWAKAPDDEICEAATVSFNAIHEERMKPENSRRMRDEDES